MDQVAEMPVSSRYDRALRVIQQRLADTVPVAFEILLWCGRSYRFGTGEPKVQVLVKDPRGLAALRGMDEIGICEAYMRGSLDVKGDMLGFVSLRGLLSDRHPLQSLWRRIAPALVGRSRSDRQAIAAHYDFSADFYLTFMDATRCYSQALFERDEETLEAAQHRKLDFAIDACRLRPGDRVLDVGGGWGSFTEHAGRRGIHVTSLTISTEQERFLSELIHRLQLPCRVLNQDLLGYEAPATYDAIVLLGVMEHLPDYAAAVRQFEALLKPGGYVYLDASACRAKHSKPTFVSRYIFPGDHSYFCLHDFLAAVASSKIDVLSVHNDRRSYMLTCTAWAKKLETARDEVIARWGDALYRRFRLYLWGSAHAFLTREMDAYRVVLQTPPPRTSCRASEACA